MVSWNLPTDTELDVGKPIKAATMRDIRDLAQAMSEGAAGAPSVGSTRLISSIDLSGETTVEFTGFDATKYDSYFFEFGNVLISGAFIYMRTSTDGGSTYDSGASDYGVGAASTAQINLTTSGLVNEGASGRVYVHAPELAKRTRITYALAYQDTSGNEDYVSGNGVRRSNADVDAVRFLGSTGTFASGRISFYGVANA